MSRASLLAALALLAACPPAPGGPDAGGVTRVKSVDVGGLVLYVAGMSGSRTNMGFGLFSPRTGRATPALREVVADGARVMAAGSPDGRTLAWLDGASTLHVATMALDADGVPTLTELRTLKMRGARWLAWANSGDRVVSEADFIDPGPDGGVAACAPGRRETVFAADGRTWLGDCGGQDTLFFDRTPTLVARQGGPTLVLTPDGQWVTNGAPLHLPERTVPTRTSLQATQVSPLGEVRPDGVVETASSSIDGKRVVGRFVGNKFTYVVEDYSVVPQLTPRADPAAAFEGRGVETVAPGPVPTFNRLPAAEGRAWVNLGPLPDGSAEAWWFIGWNIGIDPGTGYPVQDTKWAGLQVISSDGRTVTNHVDFKSKGPCTRFTAPLDTVYGRPPRGLVQLGADTWACSGDLFASSVGDQVLNPSGLGAWRGLRAGAPIEWGGIGALVTTDGRAAVRTDADVGGQGKAFCFTLFTGGGAQCVELPELLQAEPMLAVGHAVAPSGGTQASLAWVSHVAAWPGQEVRVFGNRLGASGTLRLGDVVVPEANITRWSDEEIRFTLPADAPAVGRVRVDAGQGHDDGARGFFLWKTKRWTGPLAQVPDTQMDLHQGLSPVVGVEAGRTRSFFIGNLEQASVRETPLLGGTHLLHPDGQCRAGDLLWIVDGPYATSRPLRCTGKLDARQPWTVVPFGQEWAQPEQMARPFHFYTELILTANTGTAPFFGKPSWVQFIRTADDVVLREPIARYNNEEHAGAPQSGSLITRPGGAVLRVGLRAAPRTLVRTESLDHGGSQWQLRSDAPVGVNLLAASVAELGGKTVVAGTDDADNLRGALRVSTDGVAFPTRIVGAASTAGSFAPIFAITGGARAGFVGVRWAGSVYGWSMTDGVRGLYTLSTSLTLAEDALPAPPGAAALQRDQLDWAVLGTRLYAWNRPAGTLHVLDTNDAAPQWAAQDFGGKKVTAFMLDTTRARVLVAAQDTLWRTTADAQAFEPWPAPVQLPVALGPMTFTSFALDKAGYAHVGVAEWTGVMAPPPVFGSLVGRPVP